MDESERTKIDKGELAPSAFGGSMSHVAEETMATIPAKTADDGRCAELVFAASAGNYSNNRESYRVCLTARSHTRDAAERWLFPENHGDQVGGIDDAV
jgi:hypothetical protein